MSGIDVVKNFFKPGVLFNLRPEPLVGQNLQILLYFFGAVLVAAFVLGYVAANRVQDKYVRKALKKIRARLGVMGAVGFIYLFFAYEGAVFLAARFWLVVWGIATLLLLFFPVKYIFKEVPFIHAEENRRKNLEKYLPK